VSLLFFSLPGSDLEEQTTSQPGNEADKSAGSYPTEVTAMRTREQTLKTGSKLIRGYTPLATSSSTWISDLGTPQLCRRRTAELGFHAADNVAMIVAGNIMYSLLAPFPTSRRAIRRAADIAYNG